MRILLLSATSFEVEHLRGRLPFNVDFLITGVGPNIAFSNVVSHLHRSRHDEYSLILQVGLAGAFDSSVKLGSVFNVIQDQFQAGVWENDHTFTSVDEMGFNTTLEQDPIMRSCSIPPLDIQLPKANGITVSIIESNAIRLQQLRGAYPGVNLESMEGAICFAASNSFLIPTIQLRAVSNYVGDRNKSNWNFEDSLLNLSSACIEVIEQFNSIFFK